MTRKDYIKLAAALAYTKPIPYNGKEREAWASTVHAIADVLEADNDRFDRTRFNEAVGFTS